MKPMLSKTHSSISGRNVGQYDIGKLTSKAVAELAMIGISMDAATVSNQITELARAGAFAPGSSAMDSNFTAMTTTASIPTPIQFLQNWLPGFVKVMTAARKIDEILGVKTVGSWEDAEIVQGIVEPMGIATEYGDYTAIPLSSYNANYERRSVVRGEAGISVGMLEEGRSSAMRLNAADTKRTGAGVQLEMLRNEIGFYGWNNGTNRTFGFLNDPLLPAFIAAPSGGWATATFQQITGDIRFLVQTLRTQSGDNIDPDKTVMTLVVPTNKRESLTVTTDYGVSVMGWLEATYPKIRVISAPELQGGNGGADVAYLFADDIDSSVDGSTDGGETFIQMVPSKFITVGVEKRAKTYVEDFSNATAGVMCKRAFAVARLTGL